MKDTLDLNEVSVYFEDILRNKDMIKQMIKTNSMVYEDKIQSDLEKINSLKEELTKVNSDFTIVENKLKLEYAKSHEEFQKHDINFKLLAKTHSHYKLLIREREDEIKKLEEQSIFAYSDYQNKKLKLDCISIQIIEAEFQLTNLQKEVDNQIYRIIEDKESVTQADTQEVIDLNSHYTKSLVTNVTDKQPRVRTRPRDSGIFDTISMNRDSLNKNRCIIY